MGTDRSIRKAVNLYLTVPAGKQQTKRGREQRRFQTHPKPNTYLKSKSSCWSLWSKKWQWVARVRAYDEYTSAEAEHRAFEASVEQQLADQKEREEERKRTRVQARALKLVGSQVIMEVGAALAAGEHKKILVCDNTVTCKSCGALVKCGAVMGQDRLQALIPHLAKAGTIFDIGAKHERLEENKPTEIIQTNLREEDVRRLVEIITERIPETERAEVAQAVAQVLRGESGN
jgi:hypothetical protein